MMSLKIYLWFTEKFVTDIEFCLPKRLAVFSASSLSGFFISTIIISVQRSSGPPNFIPKKVLIVVSFVSWSLAFEKSGTMNCFKTMLYIFWLLIDKHIWDSNFESFKLGSIQWFSISKNAELHETQDNRI